jgi:hypothetical protein
MKKEERIDLLLKELSHGRVRTANQVIEVIFRRDLSMGADFVIKRGWKFYVHLNKFFRQMEKENLIVHYDTVKGPTDRPEKRWKRVQLNIVKRIRKGTINKSLIRDSIAKIKKKGKIK